MSIDETTEKCLNELYKILQDSSIQISESKKEVVYKGFLSNFLQDLEFLNQIPITLENQRYIFLILRNILEQIIIFKYLNKKYKENTPETANIYKDYLGEYINFDDLQTSNEESSDTDSNTETVKDIINSLKKIGGSRTSLYKNIFAKLSKEFEPIDEPDDASLYNLYCYLSDYCHNSYYHSILDVLGKDLDTEDGVDDETLKLIKLKEEITIYKNLFIYNVYEEYI